MVNIIDSDQVIKVKPVMISEWFGAFNFFRRKKKQIRKSHHKKIHVQVWEEAGTHKLKLLTGNWSMIAGHYLVKEIDLDL